MITKILKIPFLKRLIPSLSIRFLKLIKKNRGYFNINGLMMYLDFLDPIDRSIILNQSYDSEEINILEKLIKDNFVGIFIDIGSNCGFYSFHFARKDLKVFAFEPVPEIYEELKSNIKLNFCQNIILFNCALGNQNESILFNVSDFEGGSGASSENLKFGKEIKVSKRKLDDLMNDQNLDNIDFLKIDIEGGELNMLKGAEKLIEKYKPKMLLEIVDIHCDRFEHLPEDICNFLFNKGYDGRYFGNEHSKKLNDINIDEFEKPNLKNLKNGNYYFYYSK